MGSLDKVNLARIRDNQRRSRARHKEYVADLEMRLKRFERQGVEATWAIQQVARRVADDNIKMRALLNRMGFDNERITSFLQTGSLDLSETQISNLSHEQVDMIQTLELLLASHYPEGHKPEPDTSSPSAACSVMYNDDESSMSLTYGQDKVRTHDTAIYNSIQLHEKPLPNANMLGFESQGYSQWSRLANSAGNIQGGSLDYSVGLLEQNDNFQLGQAIQCNTNLNFQDIVHNENEPNMGQLWGEYSRICSPPASREPSYSMPVGNTIQDPLYQYSGLSYQAFTEQYIGQWNDTEPVNFYLQ
ncbi:hypothetical protein M434DRAFT_266211 [Hypoxylon sp. CO27-5]|nr:hypothetical protein M434DRAFT_266211 [Hypoxylon sp. CO27-5]